MNNYHRANRDRWNLGSPAWAAMHERRGTWRIAHRQPKEVFLPQELDLIGTVENREVCVLGSGDNLAAFGFAGMGARVTSVDISAEQLSVARRRAADLGLAIRFVEADVADLSCLESCGYDLVYTGGHVGVWGIRSPGILPPKPSGFCGREVCSWSTSTIPSAGYGRTRLTPWRFRQATSTMDRMNTASRMICSPINPAT